uniref:Uncharacterized protein n=1 Tax=Dromaius novaehollandiae TaxID=8790 RepID=A0A8C4JEJ6_DRONO
APRCHSQHSSGFSSELSPQSSSPSHFQASGLHSVLLHWNSRDTLALPPVPQFSSSVPSMQSASASQRQRMGMQCPFLHWNWSNSQRGVQSFCRGRQGTRWVSGNAARNRCSAPPRCPRAGQGKG